ncbi:hypothetical protein LCGC14_1390780 [marine sediment metagenome]|uniref:Uncharacterized protein n=1 Tax=marine sediment metagenome TaxID=412755 RepID=A0A0F9K092_9ZZZZ
MEPGTIGVLAAVLVGFMLRQGVPVRRIIGRLNGGVKPTQLDRVLELLEALVKRTQTRGILDDHDDEDEGQGAA